jgi:hypothetical protein
MRRIAEVSKTCTSTDSSGYDDWLHGYNKDKWWFIGWGCQALHGTYCDKRTWCFDHQLGGKTRLHDGTTWLLTWQEQRHGDSSIFSVLVHMTKKTCGDVYDAHCGRRAWPPERWNIGNTLANRHQRGCGAAGTVNTRYEHISFIFGHIAMKLCRGMCNYIDDSLAKGCILGFTGLTRMSLPKTGWLLFGQQG